MAEPADDAGRRPYPNLPAAPCAGATSLPWLRRPRPQWRAAPAGAAAGSSIGFALGSGALHGWAHIGIVRGCARIGLQPFAIAGCNAGAAVGALWAAGLAADEITRIAQRFEWQPSGGTLALLVGGRRRNDALREEIDRGVRGRQDR